MNVIFYISDQHRWDCMGNSGHPIIKTPNLDRFADEGIKLEHMYAQYPLCGPSRACYATGQYPQTHGARFNGPSVHPYAPKIADLFQKSGYRTGMVGIVDLEPRVGKYHGYDTYLYKDQYESWAHEKGVEDAFSWQRNKSPKKIAHHHYGTLPYSYEKHFSTWVADQCMALLDDWKEEPFFMWVGDRIPHPPYLTPTPYDTMYKPEDIPLSPSIECEPNEIQSLKEATAHYYGLISLMDHNFGRIIDHLKKTGLYDNTLIVYCSDHGNMIGQHGLYGKTYLYDDDVRLPFILRYPDQPESGMVIDALLEQIDVLPTLLDIVGIPEPRSVQGTSFIPVIEGKHKGKEAVYAYQSNEWQTKRQMIRTKDWKLIHMADGGKLFDLKNDQEEIVNLYGHPDYVEIEYGLKDKLLNWHLTTVDTTLPSVFPIHHQEGDVWVDKYLE